MKNLNVYLCIVKSKEGDEMKNDFKVNSISNNGNKDVKWTDFLLIFASLISISIDTLLRLSMFVLFSVVIYQVCPILVAPFVALSILGIPIKFVGKCLAPILQKRHQELS